MARTGRLPCISTAAMDARFCIRSARISSRETTSAAAVGESELRCFVGVKICRGMVLPHDSHPASHIGLVER